MAAAIVVGPNRWSTEKRIPTRHFTLADVPPGTYTVVAWHRSAGFFRQKIRVAADRPAAVQFLIPIGDDHTPNRIAQR